MEKKLNNKLLPVLSGFFIMGFVDIVGISVNYVKKDFVLSDLMANMLPLMVFIWFFLLSVPSGMLMNRIGRKNTVLLSMLVTALALVIPVFEKSFGMYMLAFAALGIGNTIMQVSLNPLVANVIRGDKLAGSLTLGQFIKAIASFIGPFFAAYAAKFSGNWANIFPVYAIVTVLSAAWLLSAKIEREATPAEKLSFHQVLKLLLNKYILLFFIGILMVVGIDVGLNTTVPKFLMERCGLPLEKAGMGSSLYFASRTLGTLSGAFLLNRINIKKFFFFTSLAGLLSYAAILPLHSFWLILILVFIAGMAVSNTFSILFSFAIQAMPKRTNDISGLMIMGISGGALILPFMGWLTDRFSLVAGMSALLICLLYLVICALIVILKLKHTAIE